MLYKEMRQWTMQTDREKEEKDRKLEREREGGKQTPSGV